MTLEKSREMRNPMTPKAAHKLVDKLKGVGTVLSDISYAAIVLDDRVRELENILKVNRESYRQLYEELKAQRDALFRATVEMLDVIESTYYEDDDGAPNNNDMNRWHGAVQDAEAVDVENNEEAGSE